MVYEPAEDSELLASVVRTHARGRVLDIGTGSGILARTAHEKGLRVLAVDNDPDVIRALRRESFTVLRSDGFSNVRGKFDTIICNPPYLPDETGEDAHGNDVALHGGKHGYEYINRIITDAAAHIAPRGQFIFLISTLTQPLQVENCLTGNGYVFSIIAREKLFMEELLVYRAALRFDKPATLIGRGKRSLVFALGRDAVKVSTSMRATKEAQLLRSANKLGIGPRYRRHTGDCLFMQRVAGECFDDYVTRTRDKKVIRALLTQAYALDLAGIKKQELNRPGKNVLVTASRRVVLLDFERSIHSPRPGNVNQLASWLARLLNADAHSLRHACAFYKKKPSLSTFKKVLGALNL